MILIIDNYDSFTYNLYQALAVMVSEVKIVRNDAITLEEIKQFSPDGIILSPGPGHPQNAGICVDVVQKLGRRIPMLGVCLGHQAIAVAFGGVVSRAAHAIHGKFTSVTHDVTAFSRNTLFEGIPSKFRGGRYHSLVVQRYNAFPFNELCIDAEDAYGDIMALSHRFYPIFGVQFHPESILTPEGDHILKNFVDFCEKFKERYA